jgi:hypothetical protein
MALVTVNGLSVIEARITLPRSGRWGAELSVDSASTDSLTGQVTIDLGGQLQLVGTARQVGVHVDLVTMEVVGGAAGLLKQIPAKAYQGVPLSLPLSDALATAGERLSPTSDAGFLSTFLPKWTRVRSTLQEELLNLLAKGPAGVVGRILPDGTLWVGVDTFPEVELAADLIRTDYNSNQAELGVSVPTLLPGVTILGRRVEEVTHTITPKEVRTLLQFAGAADDPTVEPTTSSTTADLDRVVDRRIRHTRFHRVFPAKVVSQNADGTLELQPDGDLLPGLSGVPIRPFAPGVLINVAPGSRCGVKFESGDPQQPVAISFESGSGDVTKVSIGAGAADAAALASLVNARISALEQSLISFINTIFNLHTHEVTSTGAPSAPPLPVGSPPSAGSDVSSALLKLKS